MKPFSVKVKLYSKYLDRFSAPYGLSTRCRGMQIEKWSHFPSEQNISFQLCLLENKVLQIRVVSVSDKDEVIFLENIVTKVVSDNAQVQFSVKCPAVACKYLTLVKNQLYINRFQVTLCSDAEFFEVYNLLQRLNFKLKCGKSLNSVGHHLYLGEFQDRTVMSANNSHLSFSQDIIQSQIFEEANSNIYASRGYQYTQPTQESSIFPSTNWSIEKTDNLARLHTVASLETTYSSQQQKRPSPSNLLPLSFESNNGESYGDSEVTKPKLQEEVGYTTDSKMEGRTLKSGKPENTEKPGTLNDNINIDNATDTTTNTGSKSYNQKEKDFPCKESLAQSVVVPNGGGTQSADLKEAEEVPAAIITSQKTRDPDQKRPEKHVKDDRTPTTISKRVIREKLRDKKFIKWVNRVEQALATMAADPSAMNT